MADKNRNNDFDDEFFFPETELSPEEGYAGRHDAGRDSLADAEDALASELKKLTGARGETPRSDERARRSGPPTAREDGAGTLAGRDETPPVPRRGLFGRQRKRPIEYSEAAPVTVGRDLRSDQMLVYDSELDEIDYTDEEDLPEVRDYMPIRFKRYAGRGVAGGILYGLFVISVSIVLACLAWMFAADVLALNKEYEDAIVVIDEYEPTGDQPTVSIVNDQERPIKADIDQVATALKNGGIIEYKWLFKLFSRFSHAETKIDPGTYALTTELDYRAIVTALQFGSGNQEITRITFPEGLTLEQTFTLLEENHIAHKKDLYEAAANHEFDYDFLDPELLGDAARLEGYLFPDTYDFYQGEDAEVAINRFLRNFNNKLDDDVRAAAESRGLSVHELLTVASLIEKEAGSDEERATIASVIYNRLDAGWKLQLDSTINYIKGTSTFALTNSDLEIDSPYNTYMYEGLPVGPICSPGMASIEAALHPESTNYWFWYASDGVTTFFTNVDDFNAFAEAHPY